MSTQQNIIYIKSGGQRIALYAELGSYFSPDGTLNEPAFRTFIHQALLAHTNPDQPSEESAGEWLSSYLEIVLEYLDEKGLDAAICRLVEVAMDESTTLGIDKVSIDPRRMHHLLTVAAVRETGESNGVRRQDPDEKRKRIIECAVQVFTERGFHHATIDEIAAASGVAKGTVYRYFKSKEDLLDQLLMATSQKIIARFSHTFNTPITIRESIEQFIIEWLQFIEENHALYRLIQAEGIIPHSGKPTLFYEYLIANFPMVKERIVSMNAEGELKTLSFSTVMYGVLGFIDGVVHKWFRSAMQYPLHDEAPIILEVLFNGLLQDTCKNKAYYPPSTDTSPQA